MNNILKYILDAGLVTPIAVITMTLVYYFDLDDLLLPIQVVGMCGMLFNLYWLIYVKKKRNDWGFLLVVWGKNLTMLYVIESLEITMLKIDWESRTFEEKIIIVVFLVGMLAWWAYGEYKIDNPDD